MNFKSFSKIAAVGAVAMTVAMQAAGVVAAPYTIGADIAVPFSANVDNSIDVAVTPGTFGTIAAHKGTVGDTSSATLPAAAGPQVVVDSHSTGLGTAKQSLIVGEDTSSAAAAIVTVTEVFQNEDMFVTFNNCVNITNGTDTFDLVTITSSLGTSYACSNGATYSTPAPVTATGTTLPLFYIGATIQTQTAATPVAYATGTYTGSVDMQIIY